MRENVTEAVTEWGGEGEGRRAVRACVEGNGSAAANHLPDALHETEVRLTIHIHTHRTSLVGTAMN